MSASALHEADRIYTPVYTGGWVGPIAVMNLTVHQNILITREIIQERKRTTDFFNNVPWNKKSYQRRCLWS
jgi:hypothetical protein